MTAAVSAPAAMLSRMIPAKNAKFGMKRAYVFISPSQLGTRCFGFVRSIWTVHFIIGLTRSGLGWWPAADTMKPVTVSEDQPKNSFFAFRPRPASPSRVNASSAVLSSPGVSPAPDARSST